MEVQAAGNQPEPWVYRPQSWDHSELIEIHNKRPIPTSAPDEIQVTLQGQEGTVPGFTLSATDQGLRLRDQLIHYSNIRYVSTNCRALCRGDGQDDRFIILVSTRQMTPDQCEIFNMYIKPQTAEIALDILNFLHFHIFRYLKTVTGQEDPTVLQQYIRPLLCAKIKVQVHWRPQRKTWDEERIVMLDQECMALYTKPFQEQPIDAMFFWEEQDDKSMAKVSYIKSAHKIFMQSRHLYVVVNCNQKAVAGEIDTMKTCFSEAVKSIPKRAFEDPSIMLQWLSGSYESPGQDKTEESENQAPPKPAKELEQGEMKKLTQLEGELEQSQQIGEDSPERLLWNNYRPSLEEALVNSRLPQVAEKDWGYDPDSVDNLLDAIAHIEKDMFSKVDYQAALATTLAMKRLFLESQVAGIRRIVEERPMDLLCKICLRGNVTLKRESEVKAGVRPPGGAEMPEEAGDLLTQEDIDEEMDEDL